MTHAAEYEIVIESAVATARKEILEDVLRGDVPADVVGFSQLHDYVDANDYGSSDAIYAKYSLDKSCDILNVVQDRLDAWIKGGGIAENIAGCELCGKPVRAQDACLERRGMLVCLRCFEAKGVDYEVPAVEKNWGVWCEVSGGVTGSRQGWLKEPDESGGWREWAGAESDAAEKAAQLSAVRSLNPTASFRYTARQRA